MDAPDTLHEGRIQRLVVVLEVDPPAQPRHGLLPLVSKPAQSSGQRSPGGPLLEVFTMLLGMAAQGADVQGK